MTQEVIQAMQAPVGRLSKPRSERQPFLALVDREYLKSIANIPQAMWEAIAYLYSEADKSLERVEAMDIPGCNGTGYIGLRDKQVRARCPTKCTPVPLLDGEVEEIPVVASEDYLPERCLHPVKVSTLKNWHQVLAWLDEVLINSQSVGALRSWQMMTGLQQNGLGGQRASVAVMPAFEQPQPPGAKEGKRGLRN